MPGGLAGNGIRACGLGDGARGGGEPSLTRARRMGPELRAGGRGEGGRGFRDRARRRGGRMRSRADASYPRRACARGRDRAPVVVSGDREDRARDGPRRASEARGGGAEDAGARARSRDERRSPRRFEARDRRTTRARARRARCSSGGSCTSTWSTTTRVSAGTPTAGGPSSGAAGAAPTPLTRCARQRVRDERGSRVSSLQMRDDTHRRTAAAPPDARIEMS